MRESELLKHIYDRWRTAGVGVGVLVGPGDDAAVVQTDLAIAGSTLLLTTDQLVERLHFTPVAPTDTLARKAVARSASDIAAMGGSPRWSLAAATLNQQRTDADALFDSMAKWAAHWNCPLVGGDIAISEGPTVLTTTIVGVPHPSRGAVLRSEAKPGHAVCVTGSLGGSLASGRHLTFEPRLDEAEWLCDELGDRLGAMLDLSDGLGRDAGRIAEASGVQISLDSQLIPIAADANGWEAALGDGEDYELCFTIDGDPPPCTPSGVAITVVGLVSDGAGCVVKTPCGELLDAADFGWEHHS